MEMGAGNDIEGQPIVVNPVHQAEQAAMQPIPVPKRSRKRKFEEVLQGQYRKRVWGGGNINNRLPSPAHKRRKVENTVVINYAEMPETHRPCFDWMNAEESDAESGVYA